MANIIYPYQKSNELLKQSKCLGVDYSLKSIY
ncbi:hypothetical protein FLBR109950_09090 [Flavobacterium branchiophilum]